MFGHERKNCQKQIFSAIVITILRGKDEFKGGQEHHHLNF